jgi:anti-sigma regulatory factor (Ser/Thr protein kinase)
VHTQAPGPHLSPVTHGAGRVPPGNTPEGEYLRTRSFPGKLDQVGEARAFTAEFVNGSPVAYDVVLCVSEFSANACLHSHSGERDGRFTVRVEVHAPKYTWVEVEDGGGPWESHPDGSLPGHGLDIVTGLASEWGVDGGLGGWIVWARLDWPGA